MKSKRCLITIIGSFVIATIVLFAVTSFGSVEKNKEINEIGYIVPEEIG